MLGFFFFFLLLIASSEMTGLSLSCCTSCPSPGPPNYTYSIPPQVVLLPQLPSFQGKTTNVYNGSSHPLSTWEGWQCRLRPGRSLSEGPPEVPEHTSLDPASCRKTGHVYPRRGTHEESRLLLLTLPCGYNRQSSRCIMVSKNYPKGQQNILLV